MKIDCAYCGQESDKPLGAVNRSKKHGAPVYCNRTCAGLARRKHKTVAQKKEEKRLYDIEYRRKNEAALKVKRAAYFQRTYDPAKAAEHRKTRMPYHVEYCRQPEYKAKKHIYDRTRYAKKAYGSLWEIHVALMDIVETVRKKASKYEIYIENGTYGKAQKRKRAYDKFISKEPQVGPLGNP